MKVARWACFDAGMYTRRRDGKARTLGLRCSLPVVLFNGREVCCPNSVCSLSQLHSPALSGARVFRRALCGAYGM